MSFTDTINLHIKSITELNTTLKEKTRVITYIVFGVQFHCIKFYI